jgi:hypothetical protein
MPGQRSISTMTRPRINSKYDRVILTVDNPEHIAARLSAPPG